MQVDGGEQGGSYAEKVEWIGEVAGLHRTGCDKRGLCHGSGAPPGYTAECALGRISGDRKSTRLNSSHSQISYAVFCLKKKKNLHSIRSDSCIGIRKDETIHLRKREKGRPLGAAVPATRAVTGHTRSQLRRATHAAVIRAS